MKNKCFLTFLVLPFWLNAQQQMPLADMSFWQKNGKTNWQIVGNVSAAYDKHEDLSTVAGTGVLANQPTAENRSNLLSVAEYGDVDVSFDFMMANHSNSGFYLMGRYEVQMLDSWGVKNVNSGDCGGIYKRRRWGEDKKEILYEGHAPRQNACLAPGLWQHFDISFQAPRFDALGKKIANAKLIKVVLNGVTVQEDVELTGPTGGPISETEAARGPFLIQGDHGPVAFKDFKITDFNGKAPAMSPVNFKTYYGLFKTAQDFKAKSPDSTGVVDKLTWEVSRETNEYAQVFNSSFDVPKTGMYTFVLKASGDVSLAINGRDLMPEARQYAWSPRTASVRLEAGKATLDIMAYKSETWVQPSLGLWISGEDFRPVAYHNFSSMLASAPSDPIFMEAKENTVFRSFMDIEKDNVSARIVHGVHVGSPEQLHYTFDMDKGAVAQIWKGKFLNTAPMWDNRGDGSSAPMGVKLVLGNQPSVVTEGSNVADTLATDARYRQLGYDLDDAGLPTFRYQIYGADVADESRNTEGGKFLTRTIAAANGKIDLSVRLAVEKDIKQISNNVYMMNGRYYLKLLNGAKATIVKAGDKQVLTTPLKDKVQYSIMW
jgi:hypothetical protein